MKPAIRKQKCPKSPTGLHRWSIAYNGMRGCIDCGAQVPDRHKKKRRG